MLRSHTRPVVRQVAAEVLSPDGSSARGYLSSEVSEKRGMMFSQNTRCTISEL